VTSGCEGPLCQQTANDLVVYRPERGVGQARTPCPTHRDAFTARNQDARIQVFPLADGTHNYFTHGDGTHIATCRLGYASLAPARDLHTGTVREHTSSQTRTSRRERTDERIRLRTVAPRGRAAEQLHLLIEGTLVMGATQDGSHPARAARALAATVLG
jgi:hypothetical protein